MGEDKGEGEAAPPKTDTNRPVVIWAPHTGGTSQRPTPAPVGRLLICCDKASCAVLCVACSPCSVPCAALLPVEPPVTALRIVLCSSLAAPVRWQDSAEHHHTHPDCHENSPEHGRLLWLIRDGRLAPHCLLSSPSMSSSSPAPDNKALWPHRGPGLWLDQEHTASALGRVATPFHALASPALFAQIQKINTPYLRRGVPPYLLVRYPEGDSQGTVALVKTVRRGEGFAKMGRKWG